MDNSFNGFPVFKGLQKPLEFMGIRGRFLTLAVIAMVIIAAVSLLGIFIKQQGGLHNKKRHPGIYFFYKMYDR